MAMLLAVARAQLRRQRATTLLVLLLAGAAVSVPAALWAAGRRAATSFETFLDDADTADVALYVCPPGYEAEDGDPTPCFLHDPRRELEVVRSIPHVEDAARFAFRTGLGGLSSIRDTWRPLTVLDLGPGASAPTVMGTPTVLSGRLAGRDAPDEVMMREGVADALDLQPGDRLWMGAPESEETAPVEVTVVGIVRTPLDLLPLGGESDSGPPVFAREGWVAAHGDGFPGFGALAVWLDDDDVDGFMARLRERLPDQELRTDSIVPPGERATVDQATDFESRAAMATAAVAAAAAAFFVAQAVSRQVRSEGADAATLFALGMPRRELAATAALRWAPVAIGAGLLAVLGTLAFSILGPVGVARRGPWERALHADWTVVGIGGVGVALLVLSVATATAWRHRYADPAQGGRRAIRAAYGSPGVRTGVGLAWRSFGRNTVTLGSAILATGLAVAAVVTTAGGAASVRRVTDEPDRFGAPWDALVEDTDLPGGEDVRATLADIPGVTGGAAIVGTDVALGDDPAVWTQALFPIDGLDPTPPVIVSGREPVSDDEIALGSLTRRRAGVDVGDALTVETPGGENLRFRVVGVTMVTDGFEPNVGHGALVTPDGLRRIDPSALEFAQLAVRVGEGPARAEALAAIRERFPGAVTPFPVPLSLANAERVAGLPLLLAAGGALVAAVTLTHALIVSVRRNRRELAVCRVLGFTRRQVFTAVATQASLLALGAVLVGVPLGIAGARWGWRTLAASFGVTSGPVVPVWVVVVGVATVLAVANLAAGVPARTAARIRPADALRVE